MAELHLSNGETVIVLAQNASAMQNVLKQAVGHGSYLRLQHGTSGAEQFVNPQHVVRITDRPGEIDGDWKLQP